MLSPSDRVKLILQIAPRLAHEPWHVVDLTLRQFSLPTSDEWRGDSPEYVTAMIDTASDESLLALSKHLGIDIHPRPVIEPACWRAGYFRLFLSHLSSHKVVASALQTALVPLGVSTFVAHTDIEPTKEWQDEIEAALATADALLAMLTPGFHESSWTDQEIGFAMGRGLLIVSLRQGTDPYGFIGKFQALSVGSASAAAIAEQLVDIFLSNKLTAARMAEGLVTSFEGSNTFSEAKASTRLLEKVPSWPPALRDRITNAVDNNAQIKDAFGVPERIKRLLRP